MYAIGCALINIDKIYESTGTRRHVLIHCSFIWNEASS